MMLPRKQGSAALGAYTKLAAMAPFFARPSHVWRSSIVYFQPPKLCKAPFTSRKRTIKAPGVGTGLVWVQPLFSLLAWSAEDT